MELSRFEDVLGLKFQHYCLLNSKDSQPSKESDHDEHDSDDFDKLYNNYTLVVNKYGVLVLLRNNKLHFYKMDKLLDVESFNGGKGDQLLYSLEFNPDDSILNMKYKESKHSYCSNTNTNGSNRDSNSSSTNKTSTTNNNTDDLLLVETKYYIYVYNILKMKYDYIYNKKLINVKYHYELVSKDHMLVVYNNCVKLLELKDEKDNSLDLNLDKKVKMVSNYNYSNSNTTNNYSNTSNVNDNLLLVDMENNLYLLEVDKDSNKNRFKLLKLEYDLSELSDLPSIENVDVVGCYVNNRLVVLALLLNNMDLLILFCKNTSNTSSNTDSNSSSTDKTSTTTKDTSKSLEIVGYCYNELYLMLDNEDDYYADEFNYTNNIGSNTSNNNQVENGHKEVWVRVKYIDKWNLFVIYSNKSTSTLLITHNGNLIKANSNSNGEEGSNNTTNTTTSNTGSNTTNTTKDSDSNSSSTGKTSTTSEESNLEMLYNNHILLLSEGYNLESNEYGNNILNVEFYYNYETEVYRKNSLADTPTLKNPVVALLVLQSGEVLLYLVDTCYVDNTNKEVQVLDDINGFSNKDTEKEVIKKDYSKMLRNLEEYKLRNEIGVETQKNSKTYYYMDEEFNDTSNTNGDSNSSSTDKTSTTTRNQEENDKEELNKLSELIDRYYKLGYDNYKQDAKSFKLFETLANCLHQFNLSVYSPEVDKDNKFNKSNTNNNTSNTSSNKDFLAHNSNYNSNTLNNITSTLDNFSLNSPFFNTSNNSSSTNKTSTTSNNRSFGFDGNKFWGNDTNTDTDNDTEENDELDENKVALNTSKLNDHIMIVNKLLQIQNKLSETVISISDQMSNNDNLFINVLNDNINNNNFNEKMIQNNILEYLNKNDNYENENNNKMIINGLMNKLSNIISNCELFPVRFENVNTINNSTSGDGNSSSTNKTSTTTKDNKYRLHVNIDELPEVEDTMLYINSSLTNLLKRSEGLKKRLQKCYDNYLYKQKLLEEKEKQSDYYNNNYMDVNNTNYNNNTSNDNDNYDYYNSEDEEERLKEEQRKRDFEVLERKLNEVIRSLMNLYNTPTTNTTSNTTSLFGNVTATTGFGSNTFNVTSSNNTMFGTCNQMSSNDNLFINVLNDNINNNNFNNNNHYFNRNTQVENLDQRSLPLKYNNYKKLFPTDKDVLTTKHDKQDHLPCKEDKLVTKTSVEEDSLFKNLSSMSFGKEDNTLSLSSSLSKGLGFGEKDKAVLDNAFVKQDSQASEVDKQKKEEEKKDTIFSNINTSSIDSNTLFNTGGSGFTSMFSNTSDTNNTGSNTGTTSLFGNVTSSTGFGTTTNVTGVTPTVTTGTNLLNNTFNNIGLVSTTNGVTSSGLTNNTTSSQVKFGDTNTKLVGYNLLDKGNVSETSFFSTINTSKSLFDIALNTNTVGATNTGFTGFGSGLTSTFGTNPTTSSNSLFNTNNTTTGNLNTTNTGLTNTTGNSIFGSNIGTTANTNTGTTSLFGNSGFGATNTMSTGGFTGANFFTPNSFTGFTGSFNPAGSVANPSMGVNTNAGANMGSTNTNDIWTSSRRSNPLD